MNIFPIKLPVENFKINFMGKKNMFFMLTVFFILASVVLLASKGLNYGIDFTGGLIIEARSNSKLPLAKIRKSLNTLNLGEISLQNLGTDYDLMIKVGGKDAAKYDQAITLIKSELEKHASQIEYRKIDYVGPQVGRDLFYNGAYAAIFSFIAIFIYIWCRFEWQFGLGLILALMHDTIATLGFMSLGFIEFNLTSIAAILTVIGYSVNDSVVIYDRIRENLRKYPKKGISELINLSLNETIFRTFLTISTTLLANLSLIVFAGEALRSFSLVVFAGIIIGTYSSIYISAPILIYFHLKSNNK